MVKILFINSVCGIRSTGRIVTDLAEEYMAQGHECKIVYGRETVPEKYKSISYKMGTDTEIKINALKARLFDNEGFNAKKETKKFIKWADNYNPDILWLHNLHGYYINIELLFDWIKSRPNMQVRWTLHDCWAFTGHCAHFDYIGCEQWKSRCVKCVQNKEYPKSFGKDNCKENYLRKKTAFSSVDNLIIITPSKWLAGLVKKSILKEYPVEVVNNTINTDIFKITESNFRENNNLNGKIIVLGVASSWSKKKGLEDFIKLAGMLDDGYKIVMVGLTDKQIEQIPEKLMCIKRTNSQKELAEIYTAADVFLNLTYEDTYPTVNLEAIACGTPCITYRTGGSVESVPEDWVVEQGDLREIIAKINEITKN